MNLHPNRIRHFHRGFMLIQVLVVGVVAGIIMLGIAAMMRGVGRAQRSVAQSTDIDNLVLLIKMGLQNPATCPVALRDSAGLPVAPPTSLSLAAPNLPAAGLPVHKISIGNLVVDTTTPYDGLYIEEITLKQVVVGIPANTSPSPYATQLHLVGSKSAPGTTAAVGGGHISKAIPLSVTIQLPVGPGPATITGCSTGGIGGGAPTTSVAWVQIHPGGVQDNSNFAYTNVSYASTPGDHSPTRMCQDAGYTAYTGACRTLVSGRLVNGVLIANQFYGVNRWSIACLYGGTVYYMLSPGLSEILCIR